ncbi:MAG: CHAD domain-containing protein, partial [Solirubrobacterales bacterium]
EVKRLADALGERRDRDVAIAALFAFNDKMPAPDRKGIISLVEQLIEEQAEANLQLAPLVEEPNLVSLRESMDELVVGTGSAA